MGPRIGVALCTYNGAPYLQAQLDSLLDQSRPVHEVVVGDDGSTDATLDILNAFTACASARGIRVEIVQHPVNLGYVANFSDALRRCRSDILLLCDQDDIWDADRVAAFVHRFESEPDLMMLHSDARLVDSVGVALGGTLLEVLRVHPAEIELERAGRVMDAMLVRNFITGATCALRRTLLPHALPVPPRWSHDEWLALVASLDGGLDLLARSTIDYRQHGGNQIGAARRSFRHQLKALHLVNARARQDTALRLAGLQALLDERGVVIAPARLQGLAAIAWRMAWSRVQLYRRPDVDGSWIGHDAPRLLARIANVCLAGAGWRGLAAAASGGWAGWRGRGLT